MNILLNNESIEKIKKLSVKAGKLLNHYYLEDLEVIEKEDSSPVTKADLEANEIIISGIKSISSIPIISEENDNLKNHDIMKNSDLFWIIDPLDGTHSFITKRGFFTVNIALVKNGVPLFGFLYSPLDHTLYWNDESCAFSHRGSKTSKISANSDFGNGYDFLVSYRNLDTKLQDLICGYKVKTVTPITSSIKLALIAEGRGDIYPRFKDTNAWDTAAGHAILRAVGGEIYKLDKQPLVYKTLLNPHFIALGNQDIEKNW
ncbi:MAG: 3'(2'),5'-bisphosphate nucleotidase CysQ [Alphaproteobacteria bacterium]|jgi:3'(2'), 5'-bisphosphate nucleotidase|nr:3'(2'),5'-bisphosphate nucleotidase CysQ [Candidatus Jidaibacter sp.]